MPHIEQNGYHISISVILPAIMGPWFFDKQQGVKFSQKGKEEGNKEKPRCNADLLSTV